MQSSLLVECFSSPNAAVPTALDVATLGPESEGPTVGSAAPDANAIDTLERLERKCLDFTIALGFERFVMSLALPYNKGRPAVSPQWLTFEAHNGSLAWLKSMSEVCIMDPVSHYLRRSRASSLAWDRSFFERFGAEKRWRSQVLHGFGSGLASCKMVRGGAVLILSISRVAELPAERECSFLLEEVRRFTEQFAETAALRLSPGGNGCNDFGSCSLTPLELRCLQWTAEGLQLEKIAEFLCIPVDDLIALFREICQKLMSGSVDDAVAKAQRMKLFESPEPSDLPQREPYVTTVPSGHFLLEG